MYPIEKIIPSNKIKNEDHVDWTPPRINLDQVRGAMKKTVFKYLKTLKKRAEMTNDQARKQNLPYRLKVHTIGDDKVFLDVLIVDASEKELERISRDVTNNDFVKLIENITAGSGLIIDDLPPAA